MEVRGRTYRIVHPAAAEALLDEADFERDERMPYWADLWPSATALARFLAQRDLSGKHAIELGCGIGLPTIVALERGAEAVATDHYRAALDFTAFNARLNLGDGREPGTRLLDWQAPGVGVECGTFDLLLAADVLYEKRNSEALAALIPDLLAPGGEILVADPGRRWEPLFRERMLDQGFDLQTDEFAVDGGSREVAVLIHSLRR